jgi:hypothetical protein
VTKEEIFAIWAPRQAIWSQWVKPVVFAQMVQRDIPWDPTTIPFRLPWAPPADGKTVIVLDLPAESVVQTAISLASAGFRPIPLFNGAPGPASGLASGLPVALVDVQPIVSSVIAFTPALAEMKLPWGAPPCFMLDANRRTGIGAPSPGRFDNRSVSFPTDFPSSNFLLHQGVRDVLLVQDKGLEPQADLAHTLRRWQDAGIQISAKELSSDQRPQKCTVRRPRFYRAIWYRFFTLMRLRRNPLGGFGGMLAQPSSG